MITGSVVSASLAAGEASRPACCRMRLGARSRRSWRCRPAQAKTVTHRTGRKHSAGTAREIATAICWSAAAPRPLPGMPFNRLGHIAVSGGEKPVAHQRARLTVGAYHRCHAAGLIQQVPDLAKIVHALLAQQRVQVRGRQAGPGKFAVLYLAVGDQDTGRMVNDAGDPAVPPGERDEAVHDQEGDQRDRASGKRCRRRGHGPADDHADGDSDREVERAELGKRAPLSEAPADDGHCEYQDNLDYHPAETARPADQFQQPHHSFEPVACLRACRARFAFRFLPSHSC
jgi:hypothetical protein